MLNSINNSTGSVSHYYVLIQELLYKYPFKKIFIIIIFICSIPIKQSKTTIWL